MPGIVSREAHGPSINLFFHELAQNEPLPRRVLDLVVGTLGSLVYLLFLPFLALLVKLTTSGKVFAKEECTGYRGMHFMRRVFNVYHWPSEPEQVGDARIHLPEPTGIGRFLRTTRLDRLPLFPLVLTGKMSVVGPHTYPEEETTEINMTYTQFYKRYAVKPGLISPSRYHNGLYPPDSKEYQLKMIDDDLKYVKKPNLWKDLKILLGFKR